MPSIPPGDRAAWIGPIAGVTCSACSSPVVRHYCRTCDEFFYSCDCGRDATPHVDHRVYAWTPGGILAIPDFDNFPQ
jgi:hypothetical protein